MREENENYVTRLRPGELLRDLRRLTHDLVAGELKN
jgi:hypothetical protein